MGIEDKLTQEIVRRVLSAAKPDALRSLVRERVKKADLDLDAAGRLMEEGARFREVIAFHAQQAVVPREGDLAFLGAAATPPSVRKAFGFPPRAHCEGCAFARAAKSKA